MRETKGLAAFGHVMTHIDGSFSQNRGACSLTHLLTRDVRLAVNAEVDLQAVHDFGASPAPVAPCYSRLGSENRGKPKKQKVDPEKMGSSISMPKK